MVPGSRSCNAPEETKLTSLRVRGTWPYISVGESIGGVMSLETKTPKEATREGEVDQSDGLAGGGEPSRKKWIRKEPERACLVHAASQYRCLRFCSLILCCRECKLGLTYRPRC